MPRVSAPTTAAILGVGLVLVVTRSPDSGVQQAEAAGPEGAGPTQVAEPQADPEPTPAPVVARAPEVAAVPPPPAEAAVVIEAREVLDAFVVPADRLALDSGGAISRDRFVPGAGDAATLVALVASWCAPCARELPALIAFSRARGVPLVIVSLDDVAGPESLKAIVEDMLARSEPMSQRLPPLWLRADPQGAWTDATAPLLVGRGDPGALPQMLLFDRSGRLGALVQGAFDEAIAERFMTHLEAAEVAL